MRSGGLNEILKTLR